MNKYYKILGIEEDSSLEEIKSTHRSLLKKYHPDTYQGDKAFASKKSAEINEAYAHILADLEKQGNKPNANKAETSSGQQTTSKPNENYDFNKKSKENIRSTKVKTEKTKSSFDFSEVLASIFKLRKFPKKKTKTKQEKKKEDKSFERETNTFKNYFYEFEKNEDIKTNAAEIYEKKFEEKTNERPQKDVDYEFYARKTAENATETIADLYKSPDEVKSDKKAKKVLDITIVTLFVLTLTLILLMIFL